MSDTLSCRACGAQAGPDSSVSGLCPACLLQEVLNVDGGRASSDQRAGPALDSTFGSFRIDHLIGKGGMAAVYAADEGPPLERMVALKVLPPEFLHDETFGRRFVNEARIIASLEHPSIVPIYASGIEDGVPWISMRLLGGGTLSQLLQHGPLAVERAIRVLADVAGALDYAHAQGVVHRDIKPSNILIDDTGRAYVGDFGLARLVEPIEHWTRSGTVVGTPQYMAPEQGMTGSVDERCDTYSLGIVAYEMLTGSPPFTGDSPIAVMMQHANAPVPAALRQKCPESVCLAVEKALAKHPADRWESSSAFANALSQGGAVHRGRRGSTLVAMAAGGAIIVAAAGGFLWTRAAGEQQTVQAVAAVKNEDLSQNPARPSTGGQTPQPQGARTGNDSRGSGKRDAKQQESPASDIGSTTKNDERDADALERTPKPEPTVEQPDTNTAPPTQLVVQTPKVVVEEPPPATAPPVSVETVRPQLVRGKKAIYPPIMTEAARRGIVPTQVDVVLLATVGEDGRVRNIAVKRTTPLKNDAATKAFVDAARSAFQLFEYNPAHRNGMPVAHAIEQLFTFPYP
jgi:hypothetical protein